jgi:hypothetical protein
VALNLALRPALSRKLTTRIAKDAQCGMKRVVKACRLLFAASSLGHPEGGGEGNGCVILARSA